MRALLIILDSVGIGHAPDAAAFGDEGSDTLGHIYQQIPEFALPELDRLGLEHARCGAAGLPLPGESQLLPGSTFGWMSEASEGKDTTTGHWEIAGAPLDQAFATYKKFPTGLVTAIEGEAGVSFVGNYPQSGTTILDELGEHHQLTGEPILYTSADSVLQVAAHEESIPLEQLYRICEICRKHADAYRIGRVIARPFVGSPGNYTRTPNRHDYSMRPPETMLNRLEAAGIPTSGVGKISDIFAGSGIGQSFPTRSNREGMQTIDRLWADPSHRGLTFVNLVDFDSQFGHRRDPVGYARCLQEFDQWLRQFLSGFSVDGDELLIISADHGNDPTWRGTDHTRERVPLLTSCGHAPPRCSGHHPSFTAVAKLIEEAFGI